MKKYKIITDTTADIPVEIAKAYDIVVLPLTIIFGTEEYKDQETITTDQLYEKIDRTNIFPKTSATPAFAYKEVFEKYLNEGYDIIFMTISSLISSTMNNAIAAAKMLNAEDRITVLDSKNLSCGIGLQVINIAQALIDGKTLDDIKIMQAMMRDNIVGLFGIQVLDFLFRGGRCSSLSYIFGKALKIKPIIELKDGKMGVKHKIISSKMKPSIKYMLDILEKDMKTNLITDVYVAYSYSDEVEYLKEKLLKYFSEHAIHMKEANSVIATHCGKGTIGMFYEKKKLPSEK